MVISSIDLKDGKVVQLKNGKEKMLERTDADALIKDFDLYGEVAVIDLDAALGNINEKGETPNTTLLKSLLRKGNVRTGGGVRSVKRAKELISLGAEKVIIGSSAWASAEAQKKGEILRKSVEFSKTSSQFIPRVEKAADSCMLSVPKKRSEQNVRFKADKG